MVSGEMVLSVPPVGCGDGGGVVCLARIIIAIIRKIIEAIKSAIRIFLFIRIGELIFQDKMTFYVISYCTKTKIFFQFGTQNTQKGFKKQTGAKLTFLL